MTTVLWPGASRKVYDFTLVRLPFNNPPKTDGNYIFVKHEHEEWRAVYIGEGHLPDRITAGQNDECIKRKEASHVFYRVTTDGERTRRAIESDLLSGHPEAYAPVGCNVKKGG